MRDVKLNGYKNEFEGCENNPVTEIQKSILKAIKLATGKLHLVTTSKAAWDVIKTYEERITLRYYTDDKNEIPAICMDGKEIYKKHVELTEEQKFIRDGINYYYDIDIKLDDRYLFNHVLKNIQNVECHYNVNGFDTLRINNKVVRARTNNGKYDKFVNKLSNEDKERYMTNVVRMRIEKMFNSLIFGDDYVSDKLKETPKIKEMIENNKKKKEKNDKIKGLYNKLNKK